SDLIAWPLALWQQHKAMQGTEREDCGGGTGWASGKGAEPALPSSLHSRIKLEIIKVIFSEGAEKLKKQADNNSYKAYTSRSNGQLSLSSHPMRPHVQDYLMTQMASCLQNE
ncbi:Acetyl-coenzyme A carboxylase carboxyl transferase subunit alpha, partial [Dissostichus eleginoides]